MKKKKGNLKRLSKKHVELLNEYIHSECCSDLWEALKHDDEYKNDVSHNDPRAEKIMSLSNNEYDNLYLELKLILIASYKGWLIGQDKYKMFCRLMDRRLYANKNQ